VTTLEFAGLSCCKQPGHCGAVTDKISSEQTKGRCGLTDPWAPPTAARLLEVQAGQAAARSGGWPRSAAPGRMSLRSVPDARSPVPATWWLPLVAVIVLATTTAAILPGNGSVRGTWIAVGLSVAGYLLVRWRIRPIQLRTGPYTWLSTAGLPTDREDPPTITLPAVPTSDPRDRHPGRNVLLLINSAAVALGASFGWSLLANKLLHLSVPGFYRTRTVLGGLVRALINAGITSVLEECGIALLILAVAGLAQRFLPARFDQRSVAVAAIMAATVVRTGLHVPLWGWAAIARLGLSFVLAWLFWRTRRIWPLIVAHIVWDTLAFQAVISPSLPLRSWCALAIVGWGIAGVTITIMAARHSRKQIQYANHHYATHHPQTNAAAPTWPE
jgi:membrane protease YdiL (CAAX protease family)